METTDQQEPEDSRESISSDVFIHRDDIPMDVMEQIESQLHGLFPGFKVVCAGDIPSDELPAELGELHKAFVESIVNGLCIDCGEKMPNYDPDNEDWQPEDGWQVLADMNDQPQCWQCPNCDAKENESSSIL